MSRRSDPAELKILYSLYSSPELAFDVIARGFGSFILLCIFKISLAVIFQGVTQCSFCRGSVQY